MAIGIVNGVLKKYIEEPGVSEVVIPDGVTNIADSAFYACDELRSITIPDSVTSIGEHAFDGCSSLQNITIPNSVMSIGFTTFTQCPVLTIHAPAGSFAEQYAKEINRPFVAL